MQHKSFFPLILFLLFSLLFNCGDSSIDKLLNSTIGLTPSNVTAVINQKVTFDHEGMLADWVSSNPAVATHDGSLNGNFICKTPSTTNISVSTIDGKRAQTKLEVIRSGTWEFINLLNANLGIRAPFSVVDGQFVNSSRGWVVGGADNGSVAALTVDGGQTWQMKSPQARGFVNAVFFLNANEGWLAGNALYHTTDGGNDWTAINSLGIRQMHFLNRTTGFAISNRALYRTTDGGSNWDKINEVTGLVSELFFVDNQYGWSAGQNLARTTNGGQTWQILRQLGGNQAISLLYFIDQNRGWILPHISTNDGGLTSKGVGFNYFGVNGSTWRPGTFTGSLVGMHLFKDGSGWSTFAGGEFFQTADGSNFALQTEGQGSQVRGLRFVGDFGYAISEVGLYLFRGL